MQTRTQRRRIHRKRTLRPDAALQRNIEERRQSVSARKRTLRHDELMRTVVEAAGLDNAVACTGERRACGGSGACCSAERLTK